MRTFIDGEYLVIEIPVRIKLPLGKLGLSTDEAALSKRGLESGIDELVLTRRQREVLEALGPRRDRSNKEVAQQLGIGETTVKYHLNRIFRKCRVTKRQQL